MVIGGCAWRTGVHRLEKQPGKLVCRSAVELLGDPESEVKTGPRGLEDYLGMSVFHNEQVLSRAGVITGLAWTDMDGATLPIEAIHIHTLDRDFKLTGQLGGVMKESTEVAHSYIGSRLKKCGGGPTSFGQAFVYLHMPEGTIPRNGPSADVTMVSAPLSLAHNQVPKRDAAMTGELTLTSQVLLIDGVRERMITTRRQKIFKLILPGADHGHFEELPNYLKEGLTVHFAKHYDDVVKVLFPA